MQKNMSLYGLDKSVFHGTKLYFVVWMGQFCPSHHVLGQIEFKHATPHYAQANLQTAGAE
jgi:allophanate hydrolase subunit 1